MDINEMKKLSKRRSVQQERIYIMDIKRAKQEIKDSIEAYLAKDEFGEYLIPAIRQRPILLMGAPGIGKTQIMEQIARECKVGLVSQNHPHPKSVSWPIPAHPHLCNYPAFVFMQDNYRDVDVPVWAMKLIIDEDDFEKPDR